MDEPDRVSPRTGSPAVLVSGRLDTLSRVSDPHAGPHAGRQAADEYIASLPEHAQAWMREFTDYVATHYPSVPYVMFRGRPMFKFEGTYLKGYVMFTAASKHFTAHAIDFDLIEQAKPKFPRASFGKGSIKIPFDDVASKAPLREFVDAVMARHGVPRV